LKFEEEAATIGSQLFAQLLVFLLPPFLPHIFTQIMRQWNGFELMALVRMGVYLYHMYFVWLFTGESQLFPFLVQIEI
jgi:uncharacterized protein YqhQ